MFFKICGMRRQEDLEAAARAGFALHGFIFHPDSPRHIEPCAAAGLDSCGMLRVGVFVRQGAEEILDIVREARLDFVQLHGRQDEGCAARLAAALGRGHVLRVLWPQRFATVAALASAVETAARSCGLLLLDAGVGGGGHGTRLDLDFLGHMTFPVPWVLAGGLGPDALETLAALPRARRPAGLDFNSKLETAPGAKSAELVYKVCDLARGLGLGPDPVPGNLKLF